MEESKEAREARLEYMKAWRKKNKKHVNEYQRQWKKENPDKRKKYQANYWKRKMENIK